MQLRVGLPERVFFQTFHLKDITYIQVSQLHQDDVEAKMFKRLPGK